jgi:diaminohydroxyphosphoribosylaminopyrimidine deaminase/5-amino-6-(5-phosphoribosylamino)uracil reductase
MSATGAASFGRPPVDPADDARFMGLALALGRRGLGSTWPNPSVGAVVVRQTASGPVIVGTGYTQPGGRPHGEAMAFDEAGLAATGGTLYVTLEPCSHRTVRGATPCVERSILAGVRRVVSAMSDPNPRIAGLGHALLRSAGIAVSVGVGGEEARRDHRGHVTRLLKGRPMVTLKIARSADGFAGGVGGTRVTISCPEAMGWVHLQRARHDAIMLGIGSVLADDPLLTVRLPGLEARSPVRVVLDSELRMPADGALARTAREVPVWVFCAEDAPLAPEPALVAAGIEVMRVARGGDGRLDPGAALELLAQRGITRVYCEGGPSVGEALVARDLVDEVVLSTSPVALGGEGVRAVRPGLAAALADPARFALVEEGRIGQDAFTWFERVE